MKTVILAAGFGSRLWPLSTSEKPKQFQPLIGDASLLSYTYSVLRRIIPKEELYVLGLDGMRDMIHEAIPELPTKHIVLVPERRNTMPHTLWALAEITEDENEPVLFKSVDHFITNQQDFFRSLKRAIDDYQAHDAALTLLCTKFQTFNNNDGFCIADSSGHIKQFVEKPTQAELEKLAAGHQIYRSPFVYIATKKTMLKTLDEIAENWVAPAKKILSANAAERKRAFLGMPVLDLSSNVFQRAKTMRVIEIAYEFVDVGRFEELYQLTDKDNSGNAVIGDVILGPACQDNLIINKTNAPLVVIGKTNTVIVQTANGSLVSSFVHAAKVGEIYKSQIHSRTK